MPPGPPTYFARHGALTDPKAHGALCATLPRGVPGLCRVIQGLLIHDASGLGLYGTPPASFHKASRQTLPVSDRIDAILCARDQPLTRARKPFERSVGTCRDFALMLCAMLRQQAIPARVRCGFALYFHPPSYEDHWVCEYWSAERQQWAKADAQLDDAHLAKLAIGFDPTDIPRDQFLLAWQAWRLCRSKAVDASCFGHGSDSGAWFMQVNLARDLLCLFKRETSDWDSWRDRQACDRALESNTVLQCDRIAALSEIVGKGLAAPDAAGAASILDTLSTPPWRS